MNISIKRNDNMKVKKYDYNLTTLPEILTAKDLKTVLRCGINRAYDLMKSPAFPSIKMGGRYIVTASALNEWLNANENKFFFI